MAAGVDRLHNSEAFKEETFLGPVSRKRGSSGAPSELEFEARRQKLNWKILEGTETWAWSLPLPRPHRATQHRVGRGSGLVLGKEKRVLVLGRGCLLPRQS